MLSYNSIFSPPPFFRCNFCLSLFEFVTLSLHKTFSCMLLVKKQTLWGMGSLGFKDLKEKKSKC